MTDYVNICVLPSSDDNRKWGKKFKLSSETNAHATNTSITRRKWSTGQKKLLWRRYTLSMTEDRKKRMTDEVKWRLLLFLKTNCLLKLDQTTGEIAKYELSDKFWHWRWRIRIWNRSRFDQSYMIVYDVICTEVMMTSNELCHSVASLNFRCALMTVWDITSAQKISHLPIPIEPSTGAKFPSLFVASRGRFFTWLEPMSNVHSTRRERGSGGEGRQTQHAGFARVQINENNKKMISFFYSRVLFSVQALSDSDTAG